VHLAASLNWSSLFAVVKCVKRSSFPRLAESRVQIRACVMAWFGREVHSISCVHIWVEALFQGIGNSSVLSDVDRDATGSTGQGERSAQRRSWTTWQHRLCFGRSNHSKQLQLACLPDGSK
jgi:hypothetical protein